MVPVQLVALTLAHGPVAIMHFVRKSRAPTDSDIEAEITKTGLSVLRWRRILEKDLPTDVSNRDSWRDDGERITDQ